jgi:hypothetical protein
MIPSSEASIGLSLMALMDEIWAKGGATALLMEIKWRKGLFLPSPSSVGARSSYTKMRTARRKASARPRPHRSGSLRFPLREGMRQDRQDDNVVDAKHHLQGCQRDQAGPRGRRRDAAF